MLARTATSLFGRRIVQNQAQIRLMNSSLVNLKDKSVIDQAKEGAQNLADKAKETFQNVKEQVTSTDNQEISHENEDGQTMTAKSQQKYDKLKESVDGEFGDTPNAATASQKR
uniref:Uncharacterized protein n=1 Tax=Panagrolaimus sp. PS1159 TaxID=55785 RepID=A0AC35G0M7_9BILA